MKITKNEAEMLSSLLDSIEKAGGSSLRFLKELDSMTVKELIECLAPNGVRFIQIKENNE